MRRRKPDSTNEALSRIVPGRASVSPRTPGRDAATSASDPENTFTGIIQINVDDQTALLDDLLLIQFPGSSDIDVLKAYRFFRGRHASGEEVTVHGTRDTRDDIEVIVETDSLS